MAPGLTAIFYSQISPALQVPKQLILHTQVQCFVFCFFISGIRTTPFDSAFCAKTHRKPVYITGPDCTARHQPARPCSPPLLRASTHTPIVGHVPLWDRLPPLQVDRAPAAALRHYFLHNRHCRRVGMGQGRGHQVSLRQYVEPVPKGMEG